MEPLSPALKSFLTLLNAKKVEYLLVGGFAVRYYGFERDTRDLDLWVGRHPLNKSKILEILQTFISDVPVKIAEALGYENRIIRIILPPCRVEILDPIIGRSPAILQSFVGKEPTQIELLTVQSGVDFEDCFPERKVDTLDDIEVNIISLKHLKMIKQAGGRASDLVDLAHLPG